MDLYKNTENPNSILTLYEKESDFIFQSFSHQKAFKTELSMTKWHCTSDIMTGLEFFGRQQSSWLGKEL